jgi:hypothetical protein
MHDAAGDIVRLPFVGQERGGRQACKRFDSQLSPTYLACGCLIALAPLPHAIQSLKPVVNGCAFEISKSTSVRSSCSVFISSWANGGVTGWWDLDSALALIHVADQAQPHLITSRSCD